MEPRVAMACINVQGSSKAHLDIQREAIGSEEQ